MLIHQTQEEPTHSKAKSENNGDEDVASKERSKQDDNSRLVTTEEETVAAAVKGGTEEVNAKRLHPFVHWTQSTTHISLRIDLLQVENLNLQVEDEGNSVTFSARGRGAHGLQDYYFKIDFYSQVDEKFEHQVIERYVLILIKKAQQVKWPRLSKHSSRLPWLRTDFDRNLGSDSDDSSAGETSEDEELANERESYELLKQQLKDNKNLDQTSSEDTDPSWGDKLDSIFKNQVTTNIFNPFKKRITKDKGANMKYDHRKDNVSTDNSKNTARQALNYKKTYLFLYNLVMFIMFLKVYIVLVIKVLSGGVDDDIVKGAALIVKLLTYTQLLETIHPILGLVPGGPLMPFTQVLGRLLVNHFLTDSLIRKSSYPYAHYLFIVWSSIEIFRYSYYALRVFKVNIYPLTWCRYTLFMPLYPMGGFCESMIVFSVIRQYEKTGQYSFNLPNAANISFSLPLALRLYTFVLLGPTILYLMRYMWRQRCKQLKEKVA